MPSGRWIEMQKRLVAYEHRAGHLALTAAPVGRGLVGTTNAEPSAFYPV